jgi:hypothetical protein
MRRHALVAVMEVPGSGERDCPETMSPISAC